MKKLLFILLFIPTIVFGQKYNIKQNISGNSILFTRGTTYLSPEGYYNVRTYGAKGDSTTLDQTACQSAIDAAEVTGGTVYFPKGKYRVNYLIVNGDVNLVGDGAKLIGTVSTASHYIIEVTGHLVNNTTLTGNAVIADNHIDVTSSAKVVAGDYIVIADTTFAYTTEGRNEEFNRVLSVAAGIINLTKTTIGNYASASTGRVHKYSPVKNIVIKGLTFQNITGNYGGGLKLDYCYNVKLEDCNFVNFYNNAISVMRSADVTIVNNLLKDGQNNASTSYGVGIGESSHDFLVYGNITENVRSNYVTNKARYGRIENNIFKNSYDDAFNTHGTGSSYIDIINNTIDGGCGGSSAIAISQSTVNAIDSCITVRGNRITNVQRYGVSADGESAKETKNVTIADNTISNYALTTAGDDYGIFLNYVKNAEVSGNNINGSAGADYGIFVNHTNTATIRNNRVSYNPDGYGIGTDDSDKIFLIENIIKNISSYNVRIIAGSTDIYLWDNFSDDNNNAVLGTEVSDGNTWGW